MVSTFCTLNLNLFTCPTSNCSYGRNIKISKKVHIDINCLNHFFWVQVMNPLKTKDLIENALHTIFIHSRSKFEEVKRR